MMRDGAPAHEEAAGRERRRRRRSRGPGRRWWARGLRALRRLAIWRRPPAEAFLERGQPPGHQRGPVAWWRRRAREATRLADLGDQFEDVLDEVWRAEREWKLDQRLDFATRRRRRH